MTCKSFSRKKKHSHSCILKKMFLFLTHLPHGNQDILGFWIPPRGCRIAGTGFQSLSVELGFLIPIVSGIPWAVIRIPKPRIPDSSSKHFPDSGIRIPLHVAMRCLFGSIHFTNRYVSPVIKSISSSQAQCSRNYYACARLHKPVIIVPYPSHLTLFPNCP